MPLLNDEWGRVTKDGLNTQRIVETSPKETINESHEEQDATQKLQIA